MARISIDDELHSEKRFRNLIRELGDEDRAIGLLYRFWHAAQDYWGREKSLMPLEEFKDSGFEILAKTKWAILKGDFVEATGAEMRFAWYLQKCRAARKAIEARLGDEGENPDDPGPKPTKKPRPVNRSKDAGQPAEDVRSTGEGAPVNPSLRSAPFRSVSFRSAPLRIAPVSASASRPRANESEDPPGWLPPAAISRHLGSWSKRKLGPEGRRESDALKSSRIDDRIPCGDRSKKQNRAHGEAGEGGSCEINEPDRAHEECDEWRRSDPSSETDSLTG